MKYEAATAITLGGKRYIEFRMIGVITQLEVGYGMHLFEMTKEQAAELAETLKKLAEKL